MFTDAATLAIAVAAVRISRRPADAKRTYGYHRFEILAATFNAVLLFGVALYILYEAYRRFNAPAEVQPLGMLVVATLGLAVNLLSMRFLQAGKDSSLNVKGAYLEVWADMLGSIGVIVAALVIRFTGWAWVDTLVAVGIGLWVLPRTWVLLKESLNILLEGAPEGVDVDEVARTMLAVPGVTGVHDLHVWVLTSGKNALTAHVVHAASIEGAALIVPLKEMLADRFKVFHTTLQVEPTACQHSEDGCNFVDHRVPAQARESHAGHDH
jgi:cobalt-zinc-cadmium efflux system protein